MKETGTYVVLGGNGAVEVLVEERKLTQDIVADTGNFTEEEESEDTSAGAESGGNLGTVMATQSVRGIMI